MVRGVKATLSSDSSLFLLIVMVSDSEGKWIPHSGLREINSFDQCRENKQNTCKENCSVAGRNGRKYYVSANTQLYSSCKAESRKIMFLCFTTKRQLPEILKGMIKKFHRIHLKDYLMNLVRLCHLFNVS